MTNLEEKWVEEWEKQIWKIALNGEYAEDTIKIIRQLLLSQKNEIIKSCPPHDLIDYHYAGAWSASVPPPNKKCTKCLLEVRF